MNRLLFGATLVLTLATLETQGAVAKDLPPPGCSVAGIVQGGALIDAEQVSFPGFSGNLDWKSGFGEVAVMYDCGNWGAQIDGAAYGFWAHTLTKSGDISIGQGHVGGDLYWRDSSNAALGISASRIFQSYSSQNGFNKSTGLWRVGLFGELYVNDAVTLGAGAYYLNGGTPAVSDVAVQRGFEGDVYAKVYATNNLSFLVRGDFLSSKIYQNDVEFSKYNGVALTAQAEYLIPDTALSVFGGGRYADRQVFSDVTLNDVQGFVGASFAFGGLTPSSLRERDRHGTFDNTSVFSEKLPNEASEGPFD